ncbi:uncharacterized protein [Primulina eburnea]|uniref:uncharacterized protein n=1 Tax=Primulina eburnea TaxID=1245227 RepID=UPI003C6C0D21
MTHADTSGRLVKWTTELGEYDIQYGPGPQYMKIMYSPSPEPKDNYWCAELLGYMKNGVLPKDPKKAYRMKRRNIRCQRHAKLQHQPATVMRSIVAACPFDQWGIDIVELFPTAPAQKKFLLVVIDYFSKRMEAEAESECNDQLEVTNRSLVQSLKTRLGNAKGNWVEELPSLLWSYRTTSKIGTGETLFSLVYGNEAVLQAEIGEETSRVIFYNEPNNERRAADLNFLEEKREAATIRMEAYKRRIAQSYNKKAVQRSFQVGDLVWKKIQEVEVGKIDPRWEEPFKVIEKLSSGAYYLEDRARKELKR